MGTIYTILQSNIHIVTSSRNTLRIGELCNMDIGIRGGKVESRTSTAGSIIVEVAIQIARCSHNLIVVYISKATLMLYEREFLEHILHNRKQSKQASRKTPHIEATTFQPIYAYLQQRFLTKTINRHLRRDTTMNMCMRLKATAQNVHVYYPKQILEKAKAKIKPNG